jgi:hypothetical protein
MLSVFLFFIIFGATKGDFVSINGNSATDGSQESGTKFRMDFNIATQSCFVFTALYISICFCYSYPSLKKVVHRNPVIKKELLQITIFFTIVMCVYIIRAGFDFVIVFAAPNWGQFLTKLLQDIFYMVWDLPIVLPPLLMHYFNYRP